MFMTDHVQLCCQVIGKTDDILHLIVCSLTGLICLANDEAIIAQQDKIQQEVFFLSEF